MAKSQAKDYLSAEEIQRLKRASDSRAAWMFLCNWVLIAASFALFALVPNPLTFVLALVIIGGRQLGLGILLHECSHRSFFSTQRWNDWAGHWLAGLAILVPIDFYRPYHFTHHTKTGTEQDPDVGNIAQYPVNGASFKRKVVRDFLGLSGVKALMAMLLYVLPGRAGNAVSLGINSDAVGKDAGWRMGVRNYMHVLLFHALFFSVFYVLGQSLLYGMWWLAYLFTHPFIIRIRQIAEHGAMPALASDDVRNTTRTTKAALWERLLFAPNFVNYHCEHHLLPTVPSYNLPQMHAFLKERGFYRAHPAALVDKGYIEIMRLASAG
ncbi:MAG: fatty acid desaturase family protein [Oleiphilaceae bacterium]|nr:fatty acid desaturase family protein [Oleiphilaceae bacterium]